jgi:iron(III) transport system substrate-binding protein
MRYFRPRILFLALIVALEVSALLPGEAVSADQPNAKLSSIVKKAAQEGEVVYQGPDPQTGRPTSELLRDMAAVTKKHYGVDLKLKIDNALSFPASTAKALTEIKAGAPPSFDLMYQTPVSGIPLYRNELVERFAWAELFPHIRVQDLEWKGQALINQTLFMLPAYNTRLMKPEDLPKNWEDFLNPKYKGKLGVLIYPDPWRFLAQPDVWGEEKTLAYLSKLMEQNPKLGRFPEVVQRVVSGETPLAWGSHRETVLYNKEGRGAPVDIINVEPSLLWINMLFVPKGARHANAAALVAAAMLTKEGQALQLKYQNATSMFRPNTPAAEYAAGHKYARPDVEFQLEKGNELAKKIRKILVTKK